MKSKSCFLSSCLLAAAKTIATNRGISASCVPKSKKNTGPGATVTETTTTTTTKIAIDTGLIGNRQRRRLPPFPAMDGLQRPSWGIDIWSELWQK